MSVNTYRAKTMQEALALVRRDLGPQAAVLRTREVRGNGWWAWMAGSTLVEVQASKSAHVPSRMPPRKPALQAAPLPAEEPNWPLAMAAATQTLADADPTAQREAAAKLLDSQLAQLQMRIDTLCNRAVRAPSSDLPDALFRLFTDLLDADVSEELARELIERVRVELPPHELADVALAKTRLAEWLAADLPIAGPIRLTPGRRRLVVLVGPTGVGKTTTIAKLAANFRLRDKRRVGLITVDTYRIAAVEQLRTYADIIDLPMEIVSTPRDMHQALARMTDFDLILMDTAGRSPRDEVKIQELKAMLAPAAPDEVHLVASSVASATTLTTVAAQFACVGTTSLLLTKLDEAVALGNLLPSLRSGRLPLSYVTHGQKVPDDIAAADASTLARLILGLDSVTY